MLSKTSCCVLDSTSRLRHRRYSRRGCCWCLWNRGFQPSAEPAGHERCLTRWQSEKGHIKEADLSESLKCKMADTQFGCDSLPERVHVRNLSPDPSLADYITYIVHHRGVYLDILGNETLLLKIL